MKKIEKFIVDNMNLKVPMKYHTNTFKKKRYFPIFSIPLTFCLIALVLCQKQFYSFQTKPTESLIWNEAELISTLDNRDVCDNNCKDNRYMQETIDQMDLAEIEPSEFYVMQSKEISISDTIIPSDIEGRSIILIQNHDIYQAIYMMDSTWYVVTATHIKKEDFIQQLKKQLGEN